jgi:hypothetical protein
MRTSAWLALAIVAVVQNPTGPPNFMLGAGSLSGHVTLPSGEPQRRFIVSAMRRVKQPDGQVLTKMGESMILGPTGDYQFASLGAGDYIVVARPSSPDLARRRLPDGRIAFAPTFYPGTPDPDAARVVMVAANAVVAAVNFGIGPGEAYSVSGIVTDASGTPVTAASVTLSWSIRDAVGGPMPPIVTLAKSDGTFTMEPVSKGVYTIRAMRLVPLAGADFVVIGPNGERLTPQGPPASVEISVGAADVSEVRLVIPVP